MWENWSCLSLTEELRRVGTAPHLGSLVELALVLWVQESWPRWCWRAGLSPCQLSQVGEPTLPLTWAKQESWP